MKQNEQWRNRVRYVVEACGVDQQPLEERRAHLPGSYVQWAADGIPIASSGPNARMSGPIYVLWRPATSEDVELALSRHHQLPTAGASLSADDEPVAREPNYLELEDPADFLFGPTDPAPDELIASRTATTASTPDFTTLEALLTTTPKLGALTTRRKSVALKNLTRVDRPERNMHGFHVRLAWKGVYYQKWLSDAGHGGRTGALEAAIAWRDSKERELGKPRTEQILKGHDRTSNTGIVGVALVTVRGRHYYRALWLDAQRKMHRRWFNIDALGAEQALRAAINAREQGLSEWITAPH